MSAVLTKVPRMHSNLELAILFAGLKKSLLSKLKTTHSIERPLVCGPTVSGHKENGTENKPPWNIIKFKYYFKLVTS